MTTATIERPRLRYLCSGKEVPPKYWEPNKSEERVLAFVTEFERMYGSFPPRKVIAKYMGCSIAGVGNQLNGLRYKGYLPRKNK